jgi:ComF family protein
MSTLREWLEDFLSLFLPDLCAGCDNHLVKGEDCICMQCMLTMPLTGFERYVGNPVMKQFWGQVPIEQATAYATFSKGGALQQMIHRLKYENRPDIGTSLGRAFGQQLHRCGWSHTIDVLVPVPLFKSRERLRGYNQAACIAQGLSQVTGIPVDITSLRRTRNTATQTRKNRFDRAGNVSRVFEVVAPEGMQGRHVLLIDDVITTGSTLVSLTESLMDVPGIRVSIAALAYAKH